METYYSDTLAEKSYMIGYVQFQVEHLAKVILSTSNSEYGKNVARDSIEKLKSLEAEAKKSVEIMNQTIADMSSQEVK